MPDKPFELAKLREHDVDVKFSGTSVKWGTIPIDQLVTHIVLKNGVMRFEPLDFGIADGHVVSNITLDANKEVPTAQAKIEARNVELKRIFPQLASPNGSAGRFGGRAQFRSQGNSVAEMFAAADGEAAVAMRGGESSTLQLVLTNIDLARAAQLLIGGDETAAIHCAVAAFHAKGGVMTPDLFVVDTSAELITGSGHHRLSQRAVRPASEGGLENPEHSRAERAGRHRRHVQGARCAPGDGAAGGADRRIGGTRRAGRSAGAAAADRSRRRAGCGLQVAVSGCARADRHDRADCAPAEPARGKSAVKSAAN